MKKRQKEISNDFYIPEQRKQRKPVGDRLAFFSVTEFGGCMNLDVHVQLNPEFGKYVTPQMN